MSTSTHPAAPWVASLAEPIAPHDRTIPLHPGGGPAKASVLGLAATTRVTRELTVAARLLLRSAVEDHGFRALAIEGTQGPFAAAAALLDHYVTTGEGDPAALLLASQGFLHTGEALDLVTWLRGWAAEHPDDPVRVVHETASEASSAPADLAQVEADLARRDLEWHGRTGQRVVHWGGTAHLVAASPRILGEAPEELHPSAGHRLRAELGDRYAVVALTFGRGEILGHPALPPSPDLAESAFEGVPHQAFHLDLAHLADAPDDVVAWWRRTSRVRCVGPSHDRDNEARTWVEAPGTAPVADAFVHMARVSAPTPLRAPAEHP
ncbi:erythromycin esterase family protein [Nocardiopsis sp. NPDC058631]|uniref:erythromycin esterase family protein n=1 Tax=Nocardiopsis sp. NPDC058631 TaxID=3346566 RepID=UPI003662B841